MKMNGASAPSTTTTSVAKKTVTAEEGGQLRLAAGRREGRGE